jgi:acyl-CoA synthetase (NDP forming)
MVLPPYEKRRQLVAPDRLRALFGARSVAVVGASASSNWAVNLLTSLRLAGGLKEVTFVHPKYDRLFDLPTVPTLRDLAAPVDLAFVMVGPHRVDDVLGDAAAAGIKNVVVLAAGYGETGEEGQNRQRELAQRALDLDLTVLGPNTIGYINAVHGMAPWAVSSQGAPLAGPVGAVFESGSMARATHDFAQAHGVGSSLWASVGNSVVLTSLDVVEYLIEDESTRAIALFLETVREPERLFELGRRALAADKPIVAFKAGRSEAGMRSAMAHTGAMATDDAVVDAAFRQAGIVRVESLEQLVTTAGLLAHMRQRPLGRRMGVVTSSGGGCNVLADMAAHHGLSLPAWHQETVEKLSDQLPEFASILNPLDTTGYGHARARPRPTKAEDDLMELALSDPGIDFMLTMMTPLPAARPADPSFIESRLRILGEIVAASPVPVFMCSNTCLDVPEYPRRLLDDNGLHLLPGAELGMSAIGHMMRWIDRRNSILASAGESGDDEAPPRAAVLPAPVGPWAEDEGRDLLTAAGVPQVPAVLVTSPEEAAAAAGQLGCPVAVKVCSRHIAHKSDIGGVVLGIDSPASAAAAYSRMLERVGSAAPDADIRGALVSPMRDPGIELLVGVTVDPTFGAVLAVGLGGVWVEVLKDVSLRVLPVDAATVKDMLEELHGAAMLKGARGADPVDLDALSDVIARITRAALSVGNGLDTLEVNPLRISSAGIEALDVLVTTKEV